VPTTVRLADISEHPDNPRLGRIDSIKDSIAVNGFLSPIVVQASTMRVLAGNHRARAASELGYTEVPALLADVDDDTARRFVLADNKTSDDADYDPEKLWAVISSLSDGSDDALAGTAYSPHAAKLAARRAEWSEEVRDMKRSEESGDAPAPKKRPTADIEYEFAQTTRQSMVLNFPAGAFSDFEAACRRARDKHKIRTPEELAIKYLIDDGELPADFSLIGDA